MIHPELAITRTKLGRRWFLARAAMAAGSALAWRPLHALQQTSPAPAFPTSDPAWQRTQDAAVGVLSGNIRGVPGYPRPVLMEGSTYQGVWQECGPHEALVYATLRRYISPTPGKASPLEVARNNHMAFFALQRPDGQLPASIKTTEVGFAQIQMVVPIAATAWELAQLSNDEELLTTAYQACGPLGCRLRQYRDTPQNRPRRGILHLTTRGHDNSPHGWAAHPQSLSRRRCA